MDFNKLHERASRALEADKRAGIIKEQTARELQKITDDLVSACKPVCIKAIEEFNSNRKAGYLIEINTVLLSFDPKSKRVEIFTHLKTQGGSVPNEEFDFGDFEQLVGAELRPYINKALKRAKIPFTFGSLIVPPGYYMK